jgi:hypothetical protein
MRGWDPCGRPGVGLWLLNLTPIGHEDGASAPTQHPNSPRPYTRGIGYPMGGGTEGIRRFALQNTV